MKCFIRANNIKMTSRYRAFIQREVEHAFARVDERIRYVVVSFRDINGTRGGRDKQCSVRVAGDRVFDVHIMAAQDSVHLAFSNALGRAQQTFIRRVKKVLCRFKRRNALYRNRDIRLLTALH
ncbi:hypothetical protein [Thalassotalea sp. PS06]|uniref:hypothetical protein n=1 Tax=Thalassotalea sp. PS06 TaxID=2594005 RepID=UPI0011647832|nr:hypothetical protein [Thalassotalea sp. PS06]QDP02594.1 hypothetical protein FNC98_15315 [Thalassotalea sp. PS06]